VADFCKKGRIITKMKELKTVQNIAGTFQAEAEKPGA